jgi:hypothetical protein
MESVTSEEKIMTMANWQSGLEWMHSGDQIEVDEEVFYYFLEVLPPVFMGKRFKFADGQEVLAAFGFAEGAEPITVFWTDKETKRNYCHRSNLINRWN